ncbi:unnamed protein product [Cunninghamella echinulata]
MSAIISTRRRYFSIFYFISCLLFIFFFLKNWHTQRELKKVIVCPTVNNKISMQGKQLVIEGSSCTKSTIEKDEFSSLSYQLPYTIVTAASANHLCALENLLYSLQDHRDELTTSFPKIVVYNLGVNQTQLPILNQLHRNGLIDVLETFDYQQYPSFWDISYQAGEYGWKTGIIHEASKKYGGLLVWMDAGNQIMENNEFLNRLPNYIIKGDGFWSPRSSFTMGRWTHPGMFNYFKESNIDYYLRQLNCNGAIMGFDTNNQTIMDTIISPWYECGLHKDCIAPLGSSRSNHRQDQAVITYLAYKTNHSCHRSPRSYKIYTHRDISCRTNLLERDHHSLLYHPSTVDFPQWTPTDTFDLIHHPEWRFPSPKILK